MHFLLEQSSKHDKLTDCALLTRTIVQRVVTKTLNKAGSHSDMQSVFGKSSGCSWFLARVLTPVLRHFMLYM